jgi:hypothetical protein
MSGSRVKNALLDLGIRVNHAGNEAHVHGTPIFPWKSETPP